MADMLKFRKGTLAQINAADKAAGTIYIAKDEKAMYVDVDASTRIRIGDLIRVASIDRIEPPFSTTSLYYVENDNALLGYDGKNWKQINGTEELVTRLTTAENAIDAVEGLVGSKTDATTADSAFGRIAKNKDDISTLKTYVGTIPEGATSTNVVDYIKEKTTGIATSANLEALTTRVTTAEGKITTLESSSANHESRITTLEGKDVALKSDVAAAKTAILGQTEGGVDYSGTVKGAYEAAAAAQAQADKGVADAATAKDAADAADSKAAAAQNKADQAYTLAESKTTTAEVKTQIEAYGYATTGEVATAKQEAIDAAKTAGDTAYAVKSIEGTVSSHENYITNTLKGAATVHGSVAEAKKAGDDALALIGNADSGLTKTVNSHTAALEILNGADTVDGSVANAKKVGTAAADQAETNRQAIATLQGTVNKLNGDVNTDGSVKKQIKDATDAVKTELSAEIDADIRAANAMEYAGTIESASGIPTSGVKNGATYVIGTSFDSYAAGDMLIAQGTENPDTGLIANPTWAHVKSGYDASLDQQLTGANNKIMLSNGVRNDEDAAGAITFAATGSASVAVANNTVTIGMVWEDFGE